MGPSKMGVPDTPTTDAVSYRDAITLNLGKDCGEWNTLSDFSIKLPAMSYELYIINLHGFGGSVPADTLLVNRTNQQEERRKFTGSKNA